MADGTLPLHLPETKRCTLCGEVKPLSEYGKNGPVLRSRCKPCRSRVNCKWAAENGAIHNERLRRWRKTRPHVSRAITRRYYERNRLKKVADNRRWRLENPEKWREICRRYAVVARTKSLDRRRRRMAAEVLATPAWSDAEAVAAIYQAAIDRSVETGVPHEVDHIVPMISDIVCGLHCEANLRVTTRYENRSKANRHWPDMP